MLSSQKCFTLFVIGLIFLNIGYIMIYLLYIPLDPVRKESRWLDVSNEAFRENTVKSNDEFQRLEKETTQTQWPKPLISLIQNSTKLKHSTIGTEESHIDLENIKTIVSESAMVNVSALTNVSSKCVSKVLENIKTFATPEDVTPMPLCDKNPPDLGPIQVNKTKLELEFVEKKLPEVHWGGRYSPPNCTARHKVAIIVPYRDRQKHLAVFLNHMHPFLIKQQIEYGIFIVEQQGTRDFNRGKLMNVGFVEAQRLKAGGWQCFVFHDIDLLPLDTRNMYSCPRQPRHMSASIDCFKFKLPYVEIFGGVSALTLEQFTNLNGFSNQYWGWGGEDSDMYYRLEQQNYHIARYKMSIARYAMLRHKQAVPNPNRYQLLKHTKKTFQKDGLSSLDYDMVQVMQYQLYTHILVNIDEGRQKSTPKRWRLFQLWRKLRTYSARI